MEGGKPNLAYVLKNGFLQDLSFVSVLRPEKSMILKSCTPTQSMIGHCHHNPQFWSRSKIIDRRQI